MSITDETLHKMEEAACREESLNAQYIGLLVSEVRSLRHELADPNYLYAGSRIHRQAIITRDASLDRLREEQQTASPVYREIVQAPEACDVFKSSTYQVALSLDPPMFTPGKRYVVEIREAPES